MGVYEPITRYLRRTPGKSVRLSFKQVEKVIGRALPKSAYRYREWWANNPTGHSHARSWMEAGWRTEKVDLEKKELFFSKDVPDSASSEAAPAAPIPDPFGAMRGSVTFFPGVDLTEPTGEEWMTEHDAGD